MFVCACACVCVHRAHLRLLKEDGALGVDAAGEQAGGHVQNVLAEQRRVLGLRDGVQVHDAVQNRPVHVLQGHPALQSAQVVPQVRHACGLDTGEHPTPGGILQVGERGMRRERERERKNNKKCSVSFCMRAWSY